MEDKIRGAIYIVLGVGLVGIKYNQKDLAPDNTMTYLIVGAAALMIGFGVYHITKKSSPKRKGMFDFDEEE